MYAHVSFFLFSTLHIKRKPQHFILTLRSHRSLSLKISPALLTVSCVTWPNFGVVIFVSLSNCCPVQHAQTNEITSMVRHPVEIFRKGECCERQPGQAPHASRNALCGRRAMHTSTCIGMLEILGN